MLEINITITDVNKLTDAEKNILLTIAGGVPATVVTTHAVLESLDKLPEEEKKSVKTPKATKTIVKDKVPVTVGGKETTATVEVEVTEIEEVVEAKPTRAQLEGDEMVDTPQALNDYAKAAAKGHPEYSPYYREILDSYGVRKFTEVPVDKVAQAKAAIDRVINTIV